ncbi:winged helix-turn-helix transcriptional regulator [Bradyrhizobium sp. TZ2]
MLIDPRDRPQNDFMSNLHYPQFCALARAAELIGERWTLLIIRELLLGPKRFGDLLDHLDGMSPTLLTSRLTDLINSNVVRKITLPRPVNAQLYELTEIGREIQPAIRELIRWGGRFLFRPSRATLLNRIGCCSVWMPSRSARRCRR